MPAFSLYMTNNYTWHALCLPFSLTKYVIRMPPPAGVPDILCHESGAVSRGGKRRSVNGAAFFARRHPNTKKARHFYRALIVIIGYNVLDLVVATETSLKVFITQVINLLTKQFSVVVIIDS